MKFVEDVGDSESFNLANPSRCLAHSQGSEKFTFLLHVIVVHVWAYAPH